MNAPLPQIPELLKHHLIASDLISLGSQELQLIALDLINKLLTGSIRGQRLERHSSTGDLSDYFKLYFDLSNDRPPRYRIVYQYIPNLAAPKQLQIIAIASRENMNVYKLAIERIEGTSK
jgi:hypothetical protein